MGQCHAQYAVQFQKVLILRQFFETCDPEQQCRDILFRMRWHEGLLCPAGGKTTWDQSGTQRRMAESAALLVDEVFPEQPVRQWVLSFPYPLRFLFASRPAIMGQVLGIVYRVIAGHLIKKAGFTRRTARTGAVTLIQRFGSALNLNLHFHMLFLDGVYTETKHGRTRFQRTNGPEQQELIELVHTISHRVAGFLEREGILERDEDDCMDAGGRAKQEPEPRTVT